MDIKIEPDDRSSCSNYPENIYNQTDNQEMGDISNEGQSTVYKYDVPVKQEHLELTEGNEDVAENSLKSDENIHWRNRKGSARKGPHSLEEEDLNTGECSYAEWTPDQFLSTNVESSVDKNHSPWDSLRAKADVSFVEIEVNRSEVENESSKSERVSNTALGKCSSHEPDFVCSGCIDTTATPRSLKGHATVHTGSKHSNEPGSFVECLNDSDDKPFKCDKCDFKSAYLYKIKNHSMSHSGEKPFKCDQCDFKSAYSYNLKTHKMTHAGEMPYKCSQCDFKSTKFYYLKRHQLSHTGEKPFKCELCDFRSARAFDLKTHKMFHSGEKPYKCDQCDFKATQSSNLRKHKMSHTGEKPFQCDQCDYKSTDSRCLRRHKITHTKQNPLKCDNSVKKEKKSTS